VKRIWPKFTVLGVRIDVLQIPDVLFQMERWIQERDGLHFVALTGMHGVMEAYKDPSFSSILNWASLVAPDGMSLVWLGRFRGHELRRRVYGPELMMAFCEKTGARYRHFFYGGLPGVPERLAGTLQQQYGVGVAGVYSPPFGSLTPEEDTKIVTLINRARPDILWVGLSTPKQERWAYEHRDKLRVPVVVGSGAAFDFVSGSKPQAPIWMREHGLEWIFRFLVEPRRLWRRALVYVPKFLFLVTLECMGLLSVRSGHEA
jgi:N-acetylglucosaminyldiphosphoundecaprenol N-acetyl-beta-D-mannosaminyltransferase